MANCKYQHKDILLFLLGRLSSIEEGKSSSRRGGGQPLLDVPHVLSCYILPHEMWAFILGVSMQQISDDDIVSMFEGNN